MTIPNNIHLSDNKKLARQLGHYQKQFSGWWKKAGPEEFLDKNMPLRIPTGSGAASRWAETKFITPNDYKWGVFVSPREQKNVEFGVHSGEKVWHSVPQDYYFLLLDHIVVQADVENGSVEQSRLLTQNAPSLHDLHNLFQFFLEEGRHSWSMVYLLLEYFGHDGEIESESLLDRMCADESSPRLLNAFNYQTTEWLSHFMWCFLADRDGKYQLEAVTKGAFEPLATTCRYMLLEEPLHLKIGSLGLERTLIKSIELTLDSDSIDIWDKGGIPLPVIQKYFNYWTCKVFDLFGNDCSHNASEMYQIGIRTPRNFHRMKDTEVMVDYVINGNVEQIHVPAENALNSIMRRQFIIEVGKTVDHWNQSIAQLNIDFQLNIPHERFSREIGPCRGMLLDIEGQAYTGDAEAHAKEFFPDETEIRKINALMKRVLEPGCCASWIAPPHMGFGQFIKQSQS